MVLLPVPLQVKQVTALDWARSPLLDKLPENVTFQQIDVVTDQIPKSDLCCSTDVLEHFEPSSLLNIIEKLHNSAPINYHLIACYDDKHTHLSILNPGQWLALFQMSDPNYYIVQIDVRRGNENTLTVILTNHS